MLLAVASIWDCLCLPLSNLFPHVQQLVHGTLSLSSTCSPMCSSQCMGVSLSLTATYSHMCSRQHVGLCLSLQPIPTCAADSTWDSVSLCNLFPHVQQPVHGSVSVSLCNLFPHVQQPVHGSVSVSLCNLFPHVQQPVHGSVCLSLQPVSSCAAASAWDCLCL